VSVEVQQSAEARAVFTAWLKVNLFKDRIRNLCRRDYEIAVFTQTAMHAHDKAHEIFLGHLVPAACSNASHRIQGDEIRAPLRISGAGADASGPPLKSPALAPCIDTPLYVCTCMCMYTYAYTHTCINIHTRTFMYLNVCMCTQIYMFIHE